MIEGVKPGAVKAASPVLNGEVEETGGVSNVDIDGNNAL